MIRLPLPAVLFFFVLVMPMRIMSFWPFSDDIYINVAGYTHPTCVDAILQRAPLDVVHTPIITEYEKQELEYNAMLAKLNRTKTALGLFGLQALQPVGNASEIYRRQAIVRGLQPLHAQLGNLLDAVHQTEPIIYSYWDTKNLFHIKLRTLYYTFFAKKFNRNQTALEAGFIADHAETLLSFLAKVGVVALWDEIAQARCLNQDVNLYRAFKKPLKEHMPHLSVFSDGFDVAKSAQVQLEGTAGDRYLLNKHYWDTNPIPFTSTHMPRSLIPTIAGAETFLNTGFNDFVWVRSLYSSGSHLSFLYNAINTLQRQMVMVADFFRTLHALNDLICSSEELCDTGVGLHIRALYDQKVADAFNITIADSLKKLTAILNTTTFDKQASWLYWRGRVLMAHRLMLDVKQALIPLLHDVAELDAWYSIVTLLKESTNEKPFCFVSLKETAIPEINIQQYWLPLVTDAHVVLNTTQWGGHNPSHIIITGPNGCGKSTVMKAIAWSLFMGHAWGIAPAYAAEISLLSRIATSLNPQEDIQQRLSSFMAEKQRVQYITNSLLSDESKGNVFVVFDEPFKGTVESEAERYCYNLGRQLAQMPHCMTIIATHLRKPIELACDIPGVFDNYQVLLAQHNNQFVRTFQLAHGPAQWWFDDAAKRSAFVDQLDT